MFLSERLIENSSITVQISLQVPSPSMTGAEITAVDSFLLSLDFFVGGQRLLIKVWL
jgi:hypothetical protein